ncbi:MAG: RsmE family RNA methyltransferase [Patescibacteria group bacterium]
MYFYIPDLNGNKISSEQSSHLVSCRIKSGEYISITNLMGKLTYIRIAKVEIKQKCFWFEVISEKQYELPKNKKIILQARIDKLYLEKLVEILPLAEVSEIILFEAELSQNKQTINYHRLEKILIRSCEQSQTIFKPSLQVIKTSKLSELINYYKPVVLEQNPKFPLTKANEVQSGGRSAVLVGPEGGWSQSELKKFKDMGLQFCSLGEVILPSWIAGLAWFCTAKQFSV